MRYVVAYDIACSRRRRRVVRLLEGHGWRMHESAFLLRLGDAAAARLLAQLQSAIDTQHDRLRAYPMCERDAPDRMAIVGSRASDPPDYVVI